MCILLLQTGLATLGWNAATVPDREIEISPDLTSRVTSGGCYPSPHTICFSLRSQAIPDQFHAYILPVAHSLAPNGCKTLIKQCREH